MKSSSKKKGGKRKGAGRKPSGAAKEAVTVYTDVSRFGGKEGARMAIYAFLDGKIENTGGVSFLPLPEGTIKAVADLKPIGRPAVKIRQSASAKAPVGDLKPQGQHESISPINIKPKTLDELKELCPAELEGFDRSKWISTERQKYGI